MPKKKQFGIKELFSKASAKNAEKANNKTSLPVEEENNFTENGSKNQSHSLENVAASPLQKNTKRNTNVGHQMQGHRPRPDKVSQYCLGQKTRQNTAENSDSEENSETIEPQKSRQNATENSDSEGNSETTAGQ